MIITLNVNGSYSPNKRQRGEKWIKIFSCAIYKRLTIDPKIQTGYLWLLFHVNSNQKKGQEVITDKETLNYKMSQETKNIKYWQESIQQETITIINIFTK